MVRDTVDLTLREWPQRDDLNPADKRLRQPRHQQRIRRTGEQKAARLAVTVDGGFDGEEDGSMADNQPLSG